MTATGMACAACGTELPPNAKFCNECGAAVSAAAQPAEYKQVTVLFADVVHSMEIAAAVGAERLREIMAELSTARPWWCSATAARWTSSPATASWRCSARQSRLEDHAFRACLAALDIQEQIVHDWPVEVQRRDGVDAATAGRA